MQFPLRIDLQFSAFFLFCFRFSDTLSLNGADRVSISSTRTTSSTRDSDIGNSSNSNEVMSQSKSDGDLNDTKQPDFIDSSADEGLLENCRILPSNCLPCLNPTTVVPSVEKRRSLSSSPPSTRRKASLKLSYKWREGHASGALCEYMPHLFRWITEWISNQELTCYLDNCFSFF